VPFRARIASTLALPATLAAALAVAAPAGAVTVGVGHQHAALFSDSSFERTRIGHARILVPWNAVRSPWQRPGLDAWFAAARAAGVTPLVTFGKSRTTPGDLPTPERYAAAIRDFRERYPWVREFSTWNEANSCGERTCRRARLVAAWWRQLRIACPGCTVLAADLVDQPNAGDWAREFRRNARMEPTRWGLHNYIDVNRFSTTYTRRVLAATRGRLWLTETGGLVRRRNRSTTRIPEGLAHAPIATDYLFRKLRRVSGRIQRIYLYHWTADPPPASWDSAVLNHHGQERRSYAVLRGWLAALRRAGKLTGRLPS
jgi:hypothetical protein